MRRALRRPIVWLGLGAAAIVLAGGAAGAWKLTREDGPAPILEMQVVGIPGPLPDGHYSYVAVDGGLRIYDIDRNHVLVRKVTLPTRHRFIGIRGIAADARTDRLYVTFWGKPYPHGTGYLLAYDLRSDRVLWRTEYKPSIDSIALSRDGRKIYMPCGEESTTCDWWYVLDAANGAERRRIPMHDGAHNTAVSPDGGRAFLASLAYERLAVVDTGSDRVVRWVGPFRSPIRPFTVNHDGSLVFVTVHRFSGFEIGDATTGRKLHSVAVQGFPVGPDDHPEPQTQTHGIALTPDETEIWIVDHVYRHLHVFDARGLPERPPRQIGDIQLGDIPKWINFTRDGRYAHISTGEIVDRRTRKVVALVEASRQFLQVDWQGGEPVRAYSRHGLGYGADAG